MILLNILWTVAVLVLLIAQHRRAKYCARSVELFVEHEMLLERMSRYQHDVLLAIARDLRR